MAVADLQSKIDELGTGYSYIERLSGTITLDDAYTLAELRVIVAVMEEVQRRIENKVA